MTANFMTHWPEKLGPLYLEPTFFPEKIYKSVIDNPPPGLADCIYEYGKVMGYQYADQVMDIISQQEHPKIHTIRRGNRWREGMDIHFKVWTGKPYNSDTYNFMPVIPATYVRKISIKQAEWDERVWMLDIEGVERSEEVHPMDFLFKLSTFDGFPPECAEWAFKEYFSGGFEGQIIGWTDFKY